jgi:hypothetical protein
LTDIESLEHDRETYSRPRAPRGRPMTLGSIARRHARLIIYCVLMLASAAAAYGLTREPTYKAESQINVGRADLQTQTIPGFVEGAKALAASYSEVTEGQAVTRLVARRSGLTAAEVRERVSATAVPDAPSFRIETTGASQREAVRLSSVVTETTLTYIRERNQENDDTTDLLRRYRERSRRASDLRATVERLEARLEVGRVAERSALERRIRAATVEASTAELEAQTLGTLYQQARESREGEMTLEPIKSAVPAGNDRSSVLQQLLFVAIVSGCIFGLGIAVLLARLARNR